MDILEYIDHYFSLPPSPEAKSAFEKKITEDPVFAEEVAFYLSAKQIARDQQEEEKKQKFKGLYEQYKQQNTGTGQKAIIRKFLPYAAAAAVVAVVIFGATLFFRQDSPEKLADRYIRERFETLGVRMGATPDSMQLALRLYNDGKLREALQEFETLAQKDSTSSDAKKYAGIVSLRLKEYDKAISYFSRLGNEKLYANPGKFYQALALLRRKSPDDRQHAKILLQQTVQFDLEGKETAKQMLDNW